MNLLSKLHHLTTKKGLVILRNAFGKQADYWDRRQGYNYYREVLETIKKFSPDSQSVIDVGPLTSQLILELDWIPRKTAIDLEVMPKLSGVTNIQGDFMAYSAESIFDLVLCLQVLEHLSDPEPFMKKLLTTGRLIVVSVPYMWAKGLCKWHVQDPVSREKLDSWSGKEFLFHTIVRDEDRDRLIAVYEGDV